MNSVSCNQLLLVYGAHLVAIANPVPATCNHWYRDEPRVQGCSCNCRGCGCREHGTSANGRNRLVGVLATWADALLQSRSQAGSGIEQVTISVCSYHKLFCRGLLLQVANNAIRARIDIMPLAMARIPLTGHGSRYLLVDHLRVSRFMRPCGPWWWRCDGRARGHRRRPRQAAWICGFAETAGQVRRGLGRRCRSCVAAAPFRRTPAIASS